MSAPPKREPDPLVGVRSKLATIHRRQVHRDDWPDFDAFDAARYAPALRQTAARQWMSRAREELGSVYEFTAVAHALAEARAPIELLGALARLVTDEVRHAELCGRMARACWPEGANDASDVLAWDPPRMPFPPAPERDPTSGDVEPIFRWAADAILCSCCIGETLSRPLFESVATVCTDETCKAVLLQILRDEHLHASFGWEALAELLPRLGPESRAWLDTQLARRLAAFEKGAVRGVTLDELAGATLVIEPGDPARPNLATLDARSYAIVFYATIENEILPRFAELGFDAMHAWATRPR